MPKEVVDVRVLRIVKLVSGDPAAIDVLAKFAELLAERPRSKKSTRR